MPILGGKGVGCNHFGIKAREGKGVPPGNTPAPGDRFSGLINNNSVDMSLPETEGFGKQPIFPQGCIIKFLFFRVIGKAILRGNAVDKITIARFIRICVNNMNPSIMK